MNISSKKKRRSRIVVPTRWCFLLRLSPTKKRRSNNKASSSACRKRRSQHLKLKFKDGLKLTCEELKGMKKLSSIDDAFHLSRALIIKTTRFFLSRTPPKPEEYINWDLYAKAFYLKLHSSCQNKPPLRYESLSQQLEPTVPLQPLTKEILSLEEPVDHRRSMLRGPFKFGFYSEETSPNCIPYHLYLLVKEADDIMKPSDWCSNPYNVTKLKMVERKIWYYCNYFHAHLPVGWEYERDNASKEVDLYDTTRQPKYDMSGYTPISSFTGPSVLHEYDVVTRLSRQDMIAIMCIIHSRETPRIWEMSTTKISFYCRICSCFGIDYHRLEAASEDDVCLMNVGVTP